MSDPYYKNKALQKAYDDGARAAFDGLGLEANPYPDHRTDRGGVTFARAFIRAWNRGWRVVNAPE